MNNLTAEEADAYLRGALRRRLDNGDNESDLAEVCRPHRWELLIMAMRDPFSAPDRLIRHASGRRDRPAWLARLDPDTRAYAFLGRAMSAVARGRL